MYATEFLLLAMVLVAVILFVALRPEDDVRPTKEESSSSRWRRFRIAAGRLATGGRGDAVVREEPDGLELEILEGNLESLPVLLGDGSRGVAVRLERRRLSCRPVHVLRLGGRPWLLLRLNASGNFPEIRTLKAARGLPRGGDLTFQGSLPKREYEIRADGKLAVSVSRAPDGKKTRGVYHAEIVKSAPAVPLLALIVALELCARRQAAEKKKG